MSRSSIVRAKKFVASKISGSKAGRHAISKLLGREGEVILKALKSATTKVSGHEKAKLLKVDTMKFLTKCYLLHQNKILTHETLDSIREPLSHLFFKIIALLEKTPPKNEVDFVELHELTMVVHTHFHQIVHSHMKKENSERFTRICEYYSSQEFIENLLFNSDLAPEKNAIAFQLRISAQPFEQNEAFVSGEMQRLSLKRDILKQMIESPDIAEFILHNEVFNIFNLWLAEYDPGSDVQKLGLNYLSFYDAVYRFKQINSRTLIQQRAQAIYEKFIDPSSPVRIELGPEIVEDISQVVLEDLPRKHIFDHAMVMVVQVLNEQYLPLFLQSEQMNSLRDSLALMEEKLQEYQEKRFASQQIDNEIEIDVDDDDVASDVEVVIEAEVDDDESETK